MYNKLEMIGMWSWYVTMHYPDIFLKGPGKATIKLGQDIQ